MTRTWWVKRLFGAKASPARRTRPTARPSLLRLEDRTVPATLTEADASKTLVITLDELNEELTVVSAGATYSFTTSGSKFINGGVTAAGDFTGINTKNLSLEASGLAQYNTIRVVDTAANTKVSFEDSGGNKYSDQFEVTLDNGSAGITFDLTTDFDTKSAVLATDATLSVPAAATVLGTGGITFRADAVDIDATGTVNAAGGRVTVTTFAAGDAIQLGAADAAGVLGLSDVELGRITAGVLQVGNLANTGGVSVAGAVTAHAGYDTLALVTGGSVSQSAALAVQNLRASAVGTVTLTDAGNTVGTVAASAAAVSFAESNTLTVGTVDGVIGVTATGGNVSITSGADDLLTVSQAVSASGNVTITTDRITIQAASGINSPGVITIQQKSAAWNIDLGSSTNLAANTLELFTVEVERLKAPTVRIGDAANTGGITLIGDIATDAGTTSLVLRSGGAVTQAAGKTLTATKLAVTGTSVALDTGSHVVATVAGNATTGDFAFKSGSSPGLTVGVVDGVTGVQAPGGTITIRSVNDLTATTALIDASTKIDLVIADGNPAGRTATVYGAFLDAPGGATITGGAGSDTFNLKASAATKIDVDGGLPSPPTLPGDKLVIDGEAKAVTVKYQGPDGSKGNVTVGVLQPVGFKQIETLQLTNVLSSETVVEGTAGDDVLILSKVGGAVVFSLNGGPQFPVLGTKFTFNGLAGDDRMLADFGGGSPTLADGVIFNGGADTDTLQIDAAGLDGSYRPSGADSGAVTVGAQQITFATAEQVDAFDAGTFSVVFPGAGDTLTVANAKDFGSNLIDALKVSGAFAPIALWNNTTVAIDTADVGGLDGNDTVTVASANNGHANTSLSIRTAAGADTVTINGAVNVTGSFAVDSVAVAVNANVTAGTTVTLTHTGELQLGAVTVSGATGVTENGGGKVTLTGDATAKSTGGAVSFAGAIDALAAGGQSLTVTAGTAATLSQSAGQTTRLKSLDVTGASVVLDGAAYKTQLGQTYTGPVSVSAAAVLFDSAAGAVTFNNSLNGATAGTSDVTVTAGGAVTFGGQVGGTKALASLTATGASIAVNGGLVRTSGLQDYNSPVTVGAGTTFESTGGGAITFDDTLSGGFAVAVNTTGTATFTKAVTVASLTTDAGGKTQVNGGLIQTTGNQTYNDAVTVGADAVFESTGGGAVAFNSTLDGGFAVEVKTTGATAFGGAVGGTTPLAKLTTNTGGTTQVNGGLVKTTGDQAYNDAVSVGAPAIFQSTGAGVVAFNSTLSGSTVEVKTAGATKFNDAVSVSALTTDAPGTTAVNTPTVTATGPGGLSFGDPVTASVNVTFASAGPVTFSKTLTAAGKDVAVNTTGPTTFGGAVNAGTLATDAGGSTAVNGGSVTTAGTQTFGDPVTVGAITTFASTGAGAISFGGSLNGGFAVAVNTTGATNFLGPVGDVTPLASLTTNVGGTTQVNGGLVRTSGGQTFNDPVGVGANATFASTGGGAVLFNSTLNGPGGVTVNTTGATGLGGAVGGTTPLAFLTTDAGGFTAVSGGLVRTAGNQTYNDAVGVGANTKFTTTAGGGVAFASTLSGANKDVTVSAAGPTTFGGAVAVGTLVTDGGGATVFVTTSVTTAGKQSFSDAVLLQAPGNGITTLTSTGGGDVTFAATVDGSGGLAVETAGTTTFASPVGLTTPLASLTTGGGGATVVGGGLVRTAAGQAYGDAVVLAAGANFTADTFVFFGQTLIGGFGVVTNSPQVVFQNTVDVGQLTVNAAVGTPAGVAVAGPAVSATAGQSYALPVTVTGNTTFTSAAGDVTFGLALAGGVNVAVVSPGTTTFGGPVSLASLATDVAGATVVRGGTVTTSGAQTFGDAVVVADQNATFTSTGGGDVVFGASLSGGFAVAVNTAGVGQFNGPVSVASLSTDAPGVTAVNTGLVQTAGDQAFGDAVTGSVPVVFQAGGSALFGSSLGGLVDVVVQSPGATVFGGPVNLASLATDAAGTTSVNGGSVTTSGGQSFGDPVGVGTGATFTSTGAGAVVFGQTLAGPVAVVVNTAGATVFAGSVQVGSLVTDAAGTTAVNGGSVATDGSQLFFDPVTVGAATTFAAGDQVFFGQTLIGPVAVVVNAPGATTFGGLVGLVSLATDAAGITVVNTGLVQTAGGQVFADAVAVNVATTFAAAAINFHSTLTSGTPVAFVSGGDVTFFAPVAVGTLTTDAGGRTVVRGGSVEATGGQSYGDDVLLGVTSQMTTAGGDLSFLGRLDAESVQGLTAAAPAGTLLFAGAVGSAGPLASLAADAVLTRLAADFRATEDVAITARGGGVEQPAGFLTVKNLGLFGSGTYTLDQLGTSAAGNDVTGSFRANVAGPIRLADRNDLTVNAAGVVSSGNTVAIRTGGDFTAEDLRGSGKYGSPLVNVGGAEFRVAPGHFGPALVTFDAEAVAGRAVFGLSGGANVSPDEFRVRPSQTTPIEVNGNAPNQPLLPGQLPDTLLPLFAGAEVAGFTFDGSNGTYTFNDRAPINFTGIESLARRALAGFVVQTGEPRDATGAVQIQYAVRIVQTQAQQSLVDGKVVTSETPVPLPGGLDGKALLQNPFVVSPSFVNPASPNAAPRLAFGDVNGDGAIDLILTEGPGSSPLVTIVNGLALNVQADGTLRRLEDLVQQGQVLAQFYAYDPRFLGGVNVTAADLDGDGSAEVITGAEQGGGPHVRVFNIKKGGDVGFFVYEPTFTGGVRVAAADVNNDGTPDLVLGAGLNGGPRVTIVDGKRLAATAERVEIANFFAYDSSFRGGIYVDAGDYNNDGFADILTGPGVGGGSHVRVFSGKTALAGSAPVELAGFFAFTQTTPDNPLFTPGVPASGVGGVAFSGTSANGSRNILVGTGRGPQVQVKEFLGNGRTPVEAESADLLRDQQFVVQGVNPDTRVQNPIIFPLPTLLGYGASVGGFADPFAE